MLDAVTNFFETLPKNEKKGGKDLVKNKIASYSKRTLVEERRVSSEE